MLGLIKLTNLLFCGDPGAILCAFAQLSALSKSMAAWPILSSCSPYGPTILARLIKESYPAQKHPKTLIEIEDPENYRAAVDVFEVFSTTWLFRLCSKRFGLQATKTPAVSSWSLAARPQVSAGRQSHWSSLMMSESDSLQHRPREEAQVRSQGVEVGV